MYRYVYAHTYIIKSSVQCVVHSFNTDDMSVSLNTGSRCYCELGVRPTTRPPRITPSHAPSQRGFR
jgi:hypothetical protein